MLAPVGSSIYYPCTAARLSSALRWLAKCLSCHHPQLAGNRLSGPFPAGFAVTNTSFWSVMSL